MKEIEFSEIKDAFIKTLQPIIMMHMLNLWKMENLIINYVLV